MRLMARSQKSWRQCHLKLTNCPLSGCADVIRSTFLHLIRLTGAGLQPCRRRAAARAGNSNVEMGRCNAAKRIKEVRRRMRPRRSVNCVKLEEVLEAQMVRRSKEGRTARRVAGVGRRAGRGGGNRTSGHGCVRWSCWPRPLSPQVFLQAACSGPQGSTVVCNRPLYRALHVAPTLAMHGVARRCTSVTRAMHAIRLDLAITRSMMPWAVTSLWEAIRQISICPSSGMELAADANVSKRRCPVWLSNWSGQGRAGGNQEFVNNP